MQTQAISKRALHYKNARKTFKISKLQMVVKKDHLDVQIHSSLLKDSLYVVKINANHIRLKIFPNGISGTTAPIPLECDLYLPKTAFSKIEKQYLVNGVLHLKISKGKTKIPKKHTA